MGTRLGPAIGASKGKADEAMEYHLQSATSSTTETIYNVFAHGSEHATATLAIRHERPQLIEVIHPRPINRIDGELMREADADLVKWLSDLNAVNLSLVDVGAKPVQSVGWTEWVRTVGKV